MNFVNRVMTTKEKAEKIMEIRQRSSGQNASNVATADSLP